VSTGLSSGHTLIVGASLAGIRAAESLRRHGDVGSITILGAERHRPYDRPPLSKSFLAGDTDIERLSLTRSENALADLDIALRTGVAGTSLNVLAQTSRSLSIASSSPPARRFVDCPIPTARRCSLFARSTMRSPFAIASLRAPGSW
jgi:hypothetical protein